ncbi:hypothetical protein Xoosp13_225 [Xanthomonas phage Xoo-sp13]|nr:hypothetical protein Xoosp13_225 [Xanthomonas phage Xoo-sp13]
MTDYIVRRTDINVPTTTVSEDTVDETSYDVTLFGRILQNYGEGVNEDLLNLLENFSCPEDPATTGIFTATPDLLSVTKTQLNNPTIGQFWYNSSRELMYYYDGTRWNPIPNRGAYAANWGQVMNGQQLPKPVNFQGRVFDYNECIWSVSPAAINGTIDLMNCNTNASSQVTMHYRYANTEMIVPGIANYLIIGIDGNHNNGVVVPPLMPSPTPTPSPSSTPAPTQTSTPSPTPTVTATITATITPTPTLTRSPTPVPSPTPQISNTPVPSPTPVPSSTPTPAPITYCYTVSTFCMGYGDTQLVWTPLRRSSQVGTPSACYCAAGGPNSHSCSGSVIRVFTNMANTFPSVRFVVRVSASNGATTGDVELFARIPSSVSNTSSGTFNFNFNLNGVNHVMVVNANWYKSSGDNNAANGTLSANYSFNTGIGRC